MNRHNVALYKTRSSGFTLVEVLVALAIVGLALPALLFYVGGVADNTAYLRDKTVAQWVASNKYTEALLSRQLKGQVLTGEASGQVEMANAQWYWEINGYESELEGVQRLDIRVYPGGSKVDRKSKNIEPLVELQGLLEK